MDNLFFHTATNLKEYNDGIIISKNDYSLRKGVILDYDSVISHLRFHSSNETEQRYVIYGMLSAVESFPEISNYWTADSATFDLTRYTVPLKNFIGGKPVGDRSSPPNFNREFSSWPIDTTWRIKFSTPEYANLYIGNSVRRVKIRKIDNTIYPDWPDDLGISGGIELNTPWSNTSEIIIEDLPIVFPYKSLIKFLDNKPETFSLISSAGFYSFYRSTKCAMEKSAIIMLSLSQINRQNKQFHV